MSLGPSDHSCRLISASLLTSSPPILLPFRPLWVFKREISIWNGKSGSESNTPSWRVMRASCRLLWSRSCSLTSTLFYTVAILQRTAGLYTYVALEEIWLIFNKHQKMDSVEEPWKEYRFIGSRKQSYHRNSSSKCQFSLPSFQGKKKKNRKS